MKEGYFREKKEKDRLQRHRDSHGAGRGGRGRHHLRRRRRRRPRRLGSPAPRRRRRRRDRMTPKSTRLSPAASSARWAPTWARSVASLARGSPSASPTQVPRGRHRGADRQCHDAKHLVQQAVNKQGGGPVGAHRIEPLIGRGGRDGRGRDTAGAGFAAGATTTSTIDAAAGIGDAIAGDTIAGDTIAADTIAAAGRSRRLLRRGRQVGVRGQVLPDRGGYGGGEDAHYDERDTHRQWLGGDRDGGFHNYQGVQQSHQQQQGWAGQNQQSDAPTSSSPTTINSLSRSAAVDQGPVQQ